MEIKELTPEQVQDAWKALDNLESCDNATCQSCQLQKLVKQIPTWDIQMGRLVMTLLAQQEYEQACYFMHTVFITSFLVGWNLRDSMDLERLGKL